MADSSRSKLPLLLVAVGAAAYVFGFKTMGLLAVAAGGVLFVLGGMSGGGGGAGSGNGDAAS